MSPKETVRKQLNTGRIDSLKLIEQVKAFRIVSFDIFDTLLKRNMEKPTDVFSIMEYGNAGLGGFAAARIKAEAKARREFYAEEVTLNNIYSERDWLWARLPQALFYSTRIIGRENV